MKLVIKKFDELTVTQLYEILKARAAIFVVEQDCVYQDLDGIDYDSLHIFYEQDNSVVAYLRAFFKDDTTVRFGRVLSLNHGEGLGRKLLESAIEHVKATTNAKGIYLEGQTYCIGFYEKFGFKVISDEFLLDGLPHVAMQLEL